MAMQPRYSKAKRLGHWLGTKWRFYRRHERRAINWLLGRGLQPAIAVGGLWIFRLLTCGALLYIASWVGLLVAVLVLVAWVACRPLRSEDLKPEWRMGWSGFGLYSGETRIDNDDPEN